MKKTLAQQVRELQAGDPSMTAEELATRLNCSLATVYDSWDPLLRQLGHVQAVRKARTAATPRPDFSASVAVQDEERLGTCRTCAAEVSEDELTGVSGELVCAECYDQLNDNGWRADEDAAGLNLCTVPECENGPDDDDDGLCEECGDDADVIVEAGGQSWHLCSDCQRAWESSDEGEFSLRCDRCEVEFRCSEAEVERANDGHLVHCDRCTDPTAESLYGVA